MERARERAAPLSAIDVDITERNFSLSPLLFTRLEEMPRYSTASGSEDSDFPSLLPPSPALNQLNSTPRFQLPFNNNNNNSNQQSDNDDQQDDDDDEDGEGEEAWDEVDIPNQQPEEGEGGGDSTTSTQAKGKGIEIVISKGGKDSKNAKDDKK